MPALDLTSIPARATTRFAPSPTGVLHLGHVANAVWTWGIAGVVGGRVLLRIEDHDRGRCRPGFERLILEDLDWLGLDADAESRQSLAAGSSAYRQSDNPARYQAALDRLAAQGLVYGCRCSRRTIAARSGAPETSGVERPYPGTCRDLRLPAIAPHGIRLRLPDNGVSFVDLRLGPQLQRPAEQCGDLLLKDSTGNWTYQFSVVVDDMVQGVDLVVRGEDLLPSTGRQLLLATMLGSDEPIRVIHHPLILAPNGSKLSKRDGAVGLEHYRAGGATPAEILGMAAAATGLLPEAHPLRPAELPDLFR